jgi:hypothetical protein
MHKNTMKCNKTQSKWCINKHGASKIIDTFETYHPPPENFKQLLDTSRSCQRIHRLIELNLVAGANFALGWIRKWHPRLNYSSMSLSFPPGRVKLQVHIDVTLQPARRIIARLLREDARFFREQHYLNPLAVDDSDQPML